MSFWGSIKKVAKAAVNPVAQVKAVASAGSTVAKGAVAVAKTVKPTSIAALVNPLAQVKTAAKAVKTVAVTEVRAVSAVAKAAPVPAPLAKVMDPEQQLTAVKQGAATVGSAAAAVNRAVAKAAADMHLPSIAATMDIGKLVTDPKAYAKGVAAGYGGDVAFAGTFYGAVKSGNFKGIVTQGGFDTAKALGDLGAPKSITDTVASTAASIAKNIPSKKTAPSVVAEVTGIPSPAPRASMAPILLAAAAVLVVVLVAKA